MGTSDVDFGDEAVEAIELRSGGGRGPDGCRFFAGANALDWSGMPVVTICGAL